MRNRFCPQAVWTSSSIALAGFAVFCLLTGSPSRSVAAEKTVSLEKMIERRSEMSDEITALAKPLTCKTDSDCATIEMGTKPCGGPWKYLLYSKKNPKASALKKKISDYNQLDTKINEAQQTMSDCMVMMKPEPKCVNSVCENTAIPKSGTKAPGRQ